jgi:nitrite reductase/ring-hydroxylating ferredoxin subunit
MIPVSLSGGVQPGTRTGTSVNGLPVVVWRGADGTARAWTDQCPHRGMRLSFGFVRGDALVCIYHGWSFAGPDTTGPDSTGPDSTGPSGTARCLAVPAHPGMTPPGKAAIAVLPVAEALGMLWVGEGAGDTTPPGSENGLPDAAVHPVRSVTVRAPAPQLRAAFAAMPPPGTQPAHAVRAGDGIVTFSGPALRVYAAIQDRGDASSSAHLVTSAAAVEQRRELCLWAALVRDHLAAVVLP